MHNTRATLLDVTELATDSLAAHLISQFGNGNSFRCNETYTFLNHLGLGSFGPDECARIEQLAAARARMHILGGNLASEYASRTVSRRPSDRSLDNDLPEPSALFELIENLEAEIEFIKADMILALALLPPGPVKSRLIEDYLGVPGQAQPVTHGCSGCGMAERCSSASCRAVERGGASRCA